MCVGVSVWLVGVVSVWQASVCHTDTTPTSHTETPTHNQCGDTIKKVAGSWWWMCYSPKHVEHRRSEIKLNKLWHQVGLLFFNFLCTYSATVTVMILYHHLHLTSSRFNISVLRHSNTLCLRSATTTRNILYHCSLLGGFKFSVPLVCAAVKNGP